MTSNYSRKQLENLGFKMKNFGYYGIYRHEFFENKDLVFVICMDKCYYESYVYLKELSIKRDSILDVARKALQNPNYMLKELEGVHNHSVFEPNRCVKILVNNYQIIKDYLQQNNAK